MHDLLLSFDPGWSLVCRFALSISICVHRGVMAWRKWLAEKGGSGPGYDNSEQGEAYRANSGRLHRRALLDRYSQHTVNCKACSQVSFLLTSASHEPLCGGVFVPSSEHGAYIALLLHELSQVML